eukprot:Filipodium_phascolosomae@DN2572_c0_g1_i7.p1
MCIQQSWCKVLSPQTMRQLHVWQSFSASQKDLAILNKILTKIMQIQEWLPQYLRDFPAASGKAHRSRSAASTSRNRDGTGADSSVDANTRLYLQARNKQDIPEMVHRAAWTLKHPQRKQITEAEAMEIQQVKEEKRIMSRRHWKDNVAEHAPRIPRDFSTAYNDFYKPIPEDYGLLRIAPCTDQDIPLHHPVVHTTNTQNKLFLSKSAETTYPTIRQHEPALQRIIVHPKVLGK